MDNIKIFEDFGNLKLADKCSTFYARKLGVSHRKTGKVCQDYCKVFNIDENVQVVCVADGHGSEHYEKSDVGSKLACEVFCEYVKKCIDSSHENQSQIIDYFCSFEFKNNYINLWRDAVYNDYIQEVSEGDESNQEESKKQEIIDKYGTTFLFCIYIDKYLIIGQLGDGAILLFNDYNQYQLFKRHEPKVSSETSSMISSRAKYSFIINKFNRSSFSYVLLSTDGIYDKIKSIEYFSLYAYSLVEQINSEEQLLEPFTYKTGQESIDISNESSDDCTIALMCFNEKSHKFSLSKLSEHGYTNIIFKRLMYGIEIYEATKNGKKYEIQIVDDRDDILNEEFASFNYLVQRQKMLLFNNKKIYVYEILDNWLNINLFLEYGNHIEKKYWFNELEVETNKYDKTSFKLDRNEVNLIIFEKLLKIKKELELHNLDLEEYAFENMYINENYDIIILSNVLKKCYENKGNKKLNDLFEYFNIIGKLSCGNISIPLFSTNNKGQIIKKIHSKKINELLCRVLYNEKRKIFALWNISNTNWMINDNKLIKTSGILKLNENIEFFVECQEKDSVLNAEINDNFIKYIIEIFE